jgi:threonine dehydratase
MWASSPYALLKRLGIEVLMVPERAVEQGIALLAEGAKVVAEGAGAAGVAALLSHPEPASPASGSAPRSAAATSMRARCPTCCCGSCCAMGGCCGCTFDIPDRPGVLADIATRIADAGGNVIEVKHQQLFGAPSVQSTELELMIEVRDSAQGNAIIAALEAAQYVVRRG